MRYLLSPFSTLLFIIPILVNSLIDRPFSSKNDLEELRPFIDAPVTESAESSSLMCVCDRMADSMALVALYNSTDGANWLNPWDLMQPMDTWYGVLLNSDGCVQCLDLDGNYGSNFPDCITSGDRNELHGTLPDELGNLTCIEVLIITDNNQSNRILSGPIPNSLGNLTFLKKLYLYNNRLTGTIPSSFSSLTNLEELFLYGNEDGGNSGGLSGEVPALSLPSLIDLRLFQNNFSSINPAFLSSANLPVIEVFGLSNNQLTNIPPELGNLTSLVDLYLYDQKLEGTSSVTTLTGGIPANLGNLSSLMTLRLEDNDLTGCIPEELQMLCSTVTNGNLTNNPNLATQSWSDFCNGQGVCCTHPDKAALKAFYEATNGDNWTVSWDTSTCDVCNWYGITCYGNGRVTELHMYNSSNGTGNGLVGYIPDEIGDLPFLESLVLRQSDFSGSTIPTTMASLSLNRLNLMFCNLDGPLPNNLFQSFIPICEGIYLTGNTCAGSLPNDFGIIQKMTNLSIPGNGLIGNLPSSIYTVDFSNVTLSSNQLTGTLSPNIANWASIKEIWLSDNQLTGDIPAEIGQLSNLEALFLSGNNFTGSIPTDLGDLSNLERLVISYNSLLGQSIPSSFGNLSNLWQLNLSNNDLSGCIPEELLNLCPNVTGPSGNISGNPNLATQSWSDFCSNQTGICCSHPDKPALKALYDATNGGNWSNPWDTTNCDVCNWYGVVCNGADRVIELNLFTNNLVGPLPTEIGDLTDLQTLWLSGNQISGSLPSSIGSLGSLINLYLNSNNLSGSIPSTIGGLSNVEKVNLSQNQLTGNIPSQIGDLSNVENLNLSTNMLSGNIPSSIDNLSSVTNLGLGYNQLTGSIPPEIGMLSTLTILGLSDNQLSGSIPSEIGDLTNLTVLHLARNQLSGSIPEELQSLTNVFSFLLNDNDLSGCIPAGLQNICPNVSQGNISNNPNLATQNWNAFCSAQAGVCCTHPDKPALKALYESTNGDNWTVSWDTTSCDVCNWHGITCDGNDRVTMLDLSVNNLTGTLFPDLNLPLLTNLIFDLNNLNGSIPDFSNLPLLEEFRCVKNQMDGTIPDFSNLPNLKSFNCSDNDLSGNIPDFSNLSNLESFLCGINQLSGNIPDFSNLPNLITFVCGRNQLSGNIPDFSNLSGLEYFECNVNQLSGNILDFSNLPNLQTFNCGANQLTGNIPDFSNLSNLHYFVCGANQLSGNIPDFSNLSNLAEFYCSSNDLEGCFPNFICNLTTFDATNNPLLPWEGDHTNFCAGTPQIGALCDDGDPNTNGEEILTDCSCGVACPTMTGAITNNGPICQGEQATVTFDVTGGTPFFNITFSDGTNQTTILDIDFPFSIDVSPTSTTTYTFIDVSDGVGCMETFTGLTTTVAVLIPPAIINVSADQVICEGETLMFSADSPTAISYLWEGPNNYTSNEQNPSIPNATSTESGAYTLTVTDVNNCTATALVVALVHPLPMAFANSNSPVCVGQLLTLTETGGSGTGWSWTGPNGFSSTDQNPVINPVSLVNAGDYTVTVTDGNNCSSTATINVVVNELPNVPGAIAGLDVVCAGDIEMYSITPVAGATMYSWILPTGANVVGANDGDQIQVDWTNASSGDLCVASVNNCGTSSTSCLSVQVDVIPGQPGAIFGDLIVCEGTTTPYFVQPIIGIINYHWTLPLGASITGQSNSSGIDIDWTGAVSGDLCLEVENNCGTGSPRCIGITVDPILQTPGPISGNSAVCEGAIEIYSVPPDPAALDYNWTVPMGATIISGQNSEAITVSFSGAVTGEICVVTLNDCGMSFPAACLPVSGGVPPLAVSGSNTPVCEGFPLTLFETGGEAVQWVWSGPNGFSAVIQNPIIGSPTLLATGDYFVTITDANGCTNSASTNVVINAEPAVVAISNSPICTGENINMEGQGAANLTWSWSGPGGFSSSEQNPVITNATSANAGTYTVTVTDVATSCTNTANVQVVVNALPSLTASNNGPACEGETVSLFGSGGSGTWEWSGPNGFMAVGQNVNIPNATSSEAGTYTLTLVATNGCINTVSTNVLVNEIPTILNIQSTDVSCFGGSDGVINIDLTGGGQPYSYTWSPSNGSGGNPNINLVNGNYTVTITTTDGCSTTSTATVSEPNQLIFGCAQYSPVTTNGGNDGVGLIQFFGGTIPYAYTYTGPVNGNGTVNHNDIELIGALEEGSYSLEVIDGNGCMQTCSFIISGPACAGFVLNSIVPNPTSCHGGDDGSIELDFSGGVLPFTFDWSGGSIGNVEDPNGLLAGNYSVTATDSDGCSFTASTTVTQPNEMSLTCGEQAPVSTNGGNDGIAGLTLGGGTMPYDYGWTGPSSDTIYNVGVGAYTISDLVAGVYQVTLTDANACTANCTFEITEPSCGLSLDELTAQAASCAGGNNGSIALTLSGGVQPYIYLWSDPSQNGVEDPTDLSAGTYSVTVLDAVGCSVMGSVTVGEPPALQLDCMQQSPVSSSGNSDGVASIQFEGGTAPYGYSWDGPLNGSDNSPNAATVLLSNLLEGTYGLTLTDDNGCMLTCSFTIDGPGCASFNISNTVLQNVSCNGANDGSIDITVTGGILPLDYMWNLPALNGMNVLSNLAPGIYDVTASDATGCTATGSYTIEEPASLQLSCSEQLAVSAIGNSDGEALITYAGGTPTYEYNWSGPANGNGSGAGGMVVLDNLTEGNYSLTLTDGNLCEETCAFEITVATPPTCRQLDSMMLVALYNATHENGPWTNEWNLMQPIDTWYGITLNANGCVSCIDLDGVEDCGAGVSAGGNNLMGALPDLAFSELQLLSLHENNLAGPIPLLTLPKLLSLGMGHCQLNGGIPVFDFPELLYLALCCNELTGGIPNMDFPNLIGLYLHENQLTGNLPLQLTNLTNLQFLNLAANQLEGCFPPSYDIFCGIDYSFVNNPDLPGGGDFSAFCADDTGACAACSIDAYVTVTNTSCGQPNGTAAVVITESIGNYTFLWSTGATTQTITDLEMGTYSVTITDGNCQSVVSGIVGFVEKPVIEWERNYGGSGEDGGLKLSIKQTIDNGYVMAGRSYSNDGDVGDNYGESDFWIIKTNPLGEMVWQNNYGGSDEDWAHSIEQTVDGGFVVAGVTESMDGDVSSNNGLSDYWVIKLNALGLLEWDKSFGDDGYDYAQSINKTFDGGFASVGSLSNNYGVIKLDQNGNLEWEKNYGGTSADHAYCVQQTKDYGYIIAGYSNSVNGDVSSNNGSRDFWIIKLDKDGDLEWEKNYGGMQVDWAHSIQQTQDQGFIVSGHTLSNDGDVSFNQGIADAWVIKLNKNGDLEWERTFGGTNSDFVQAIQQTHEGGFIMAGQSSSNDGDVGENKGSSDYWVVKINQFGSIEWERTFGGTNIESATSIQQTKDGRFIVAGYSKSNDGDVSNNSGEEDYWLVKLGPPHFPITTLGNDTTICQMDVVELSARDSLCSNCTYLWNDGNTDPVRMVSPMQDTEYTVNLTHANGCTDSDTIMVTVNSFTVDLGSDVAACDLPELDAGPAEIYEWSTGETSQTIQPMQAGEYAVTVTDHLGCTAADTISLSGLAVGSASIDTVLCIADVFVFNGKMYDQSGIYADTLKSVGDCDSIITEIALEISNLNLDMGADIDACDLANNPIILNAGSANVYSWSTGATSTTIQVNMPGIYACTITDEFGCTQEDAVEVVEIPAFEITIDTAICAGESIMVGASTYSTTGNYTEQLMSVANCDSIVYLNLTVLPNLAQPVISGASEVCSGEAAIFQITNYNPALTYGWDFPSDAILLSNAGGQAEIQFGSLSGEVTVSVSNSCETVSSGVVMVAVGQAILSAPAFSGETTVCEGETTIYQITSFDPTSSYDWELPMGAEIVMENGPNVTIQFAGNSGTLSLTETNNCGESTAYPVVINIGNAPAATLPISGDVIICGNETATYSTDPVVGALTYQWTVTPGGFMQTTDSPNLDMDWAVPGMYSLCVVAENDCGISNQPQCMTVSVLELPQGQISGDTVLCGSGEVTLSFDLQGIGPWDITYSSGNGEYDVFGITSSPHTIVQPVSMPTTFELIKVQNGNGCIGIASGTFEVSIEQQTAISIDTVLCSGEEILINGSVYADSGCYELTLPTLVGCDTVLTLCIDDADLFELLQVEQCEVPYIFNGKEIYNSGIYEDTILYSATCSTFVVLDLEILPSADFEPIPDTLSILNSSTIIDINLVENDMLPDSVTWSLSVLSQPNHGVVNDVGNGTVSLTVTNSSFSGNDLFNYAICMDECPDTCKTTGVSLTFIDDCITEIVELGNIPKAFSPNGDGINDYFDPIQEFKDQQCPFLEGEAEMLILNRWGEAVFKPTQYKAWDGKRNGGGSKSFPPATYYYVLKMKKLDGEEVVVKGPISIFEK